MKREPRATLRDLMKRALVLRDQVIAVVCVIVVIDVMWVLALVSWHHKHGRSAIACAAVVLMLACAVALSRRLRREQRDVLTAIEKTLRPASSVDR